MSDDDFNVNDPHFQKKYNSLTYDTDLTDHSPLDRYTIQVLRNKKAQRTLEAGRRIIEKEQVGKKKSKSKRTYTDAQKAAMVERLKQGRIKAKLKRQAAKNATEGTPAPTKEKVVNPPTPVAPVAPVAPKPDKEKINYEKRLLEMEERFNKKFESLIPKKPEPASAPVAIPTPTPAIYKPPVKLSIGRFKGADW